ncbi:ribonuclease P/MRP protein subunit POP5-like [Styela clava]
MVRLKHRYFLIRLVFDDQKFGHNIEPYQIYGRIKNAVETIHGDHGLACVDVSLSVKYINVYTNIVLIKTRRQFHRLVWSSLPFITYVTENLGKRPKKIPCFLHTLHVGGSIRSCQKFLIKYHRKKLDSILDQCSTPGEKRRVKKSIESASLETEDPGKNSEEESSGSD